MWSDKNIINISDVFFICVKRGESHYVDKLPDHHLKHVVTGEMTVFDGEKEFTVGPGQSIFLKKDHRIKIRKYPLEDEEFRCITFVFKRDFLKEYFQELGSKVCKKKKVINRFRSSSVLLSDITSIKSLLLSMTPYLESESEPPAPIMKLKMREAVQTLLTTDERFYPVLFDFTEDWKVDILDFLQTNYMNDLTLPEMANYTGRSLASFKRDFALISDLSPEKWIINRRLEAAYEMIAEGKGNLTAIMNKVGFKNRSHFTTAFKNKYGVTPSLILNRYKNSSK